MGRRTKDEQPQINCDTFTNFRGVTAETRNWLSLLRSITGNTNGELVNEAIEALILYYATSQRLPDRQREFARTQMVPLLRILPKAILAETNKDVPGE